MITNSPDHLHRSERKLREAMDRLLNGTARHCDGKLTKTNLAREARVSQATMYRAAGVLADWDEQVSDATPRSAQVARLETELSKSRKRVRHLEQQNVDLRRQITAAATVIAELSVRVDQDPTGRVVPLRTAKTKDAL